MNGRRRVRGWGASGCSNLTASGPGMNGRRRVARDVTVRMGLSSRKGEHRKRRGWCIGEFRRVLARMPLRYSYGKFVDDIGEHGLFYKGGKIVFCDQS
ncbi:Nucleotide-diphospho-sugar transferase [Vigna unguiculata]|uniref:Nucleotide-diphospho-sugar transferase n=1 Tax=Vigna unguiculata TaxID=3917 RepID=A0A4D6N9N2_VIGUN|nr:Nucleotide-diphospho-sugar transferase [Vigna unguiculata]